MKQLSIFTLFLAILGMVACKKTVESENNRWKASQDRIKSLKGTYPSFATVLDATLKEAEAAVKSAEGISNEEEKIKAMSAANDKANPSFVTDLDRMNSLFTELNDQISKSKQAGGDANDKTAIFDASSRADMAIREAKSQLSTANPTDVSSANAIVNMAKGNVEAAKSRLADLVATANKKAGDAKKAQDDTKAAADKAAEDAKKAAADCKCKACGTMNKAGITACTSCTAPLECKH